jgi:hypothetical protein
MDIKAVVANINVLSHAGIRIIPELNSPKLRTAPSKPRTDKTPSSRGFFTHTRRYQENFPKEVNRLKHLSNESRNTLFALFTQRRMMKPWAWHWYLLHRKRCVSAVSYLNHSNEALRKYTLAKKFLTPISALV